MKKKFVLPLLTVSLLLSGCAGGQSAQTAPETKDNAASQSQEESKEEVKTAEIKTMAGADLEELQLTTDGSGNYVYVDVRPAEEYQAGHLKYAVNILSDDIVADPEVLSDYKDKPIILYCNTGKRSTAAAEALVAAGYKDITNADGVKDFPDYTLVTHQNVFGKDFAKAIAEGDITMIDSRDAKDYNEGHIKGAINLKPEEIEANLDKIPKDKPVYNYCYIGYLSGICAENLVNLGYTDVYNVVDGTAEYDYELVTE